jgi:sporulation protein YlmC with PRC-barrel domain
MERKDLPQPAAIHPASSGGFGRFMLAAAIIAIGTWMSPAQPASALPPPAATGDAPTTTGGGIVPRVLNAIASHAPGASGARSQIGLQQYLDRYSNANDGYYDSVRDALDKNVFDDKNNVVGTVHDIIVNRRTGEATVLVVNDKDKTMQESSLAALNFRHVMKQEANGAVTLTIADTQLAARPGFDYEDLKTNPDYVSLRNLDNAQVVDDQGKPAGQIATVIYENAKAQDIYFTLQPDLARAAPPNKRLFTIPFRDANIVSGPGGYILKLSTTQTRALADSLMARS